MTFPIGAGTLLQPSRPATAIDACFFEAAFGGSGGDDNDEDDNDNGGDVDTLTNDIGPVPNKPKNYPVWSTHTAVPVTVNDHTAAAHLWGHVFALHLKKPFAVKPR